MGGVKVATTCLHWSHSIASQSTSSSSSSSSHNLSPTVSPKSSSRRRNRGNQSLVCRVVQAPYRSNLFQSKNSSTLLRTQSCEVPKSRNQTLRRALSTSSDGFSDEEFQRELQELALKFPIWDDKDEADDDKNNEAGDETEQQALILSSSRDEKGESIGNGGEGSLKINNVQNLNRRLFPTSKIKSSCETPWLGMRPDPPVWPGMRDIVPASIELKANSVDLPFSLRVLKRKTQWQEGFREAGESAYCSVKKAFSSMVFMIRELQSYSLQMREVLFYEDLQGILVRVQKEMNASFVWLFQQIFSHTPTLMVYVMILLANFTVHSMAQNIALAAPPVTEPYGAATEIISMKDDETVEIQPKFESPVAKTIIGGNKGGGGNVGSVASSGTNGEDGRFNGVSSFTHHEIVSDEISKVTSTPTPTETEVESGNRGIMNEEERKIWSSVVEEAYRMQAVFRDAALDIETVKRFVAPVKVDIEPEDYSVYSRTELLYREAVSREPTNSTILSNFAQFLYLVVHDHDRAEEYFKKAARIEPADAEALSRYANFLWLARKDIGAAEETYIEAMEADPGNTFHAGNYAHFLWNTGGEDTCYPLSNPDEECEA